MLQCAAYRVRRQAAHGAQRSVDHRLAQFIQQRQITLPLLVIPNLINDFHAAHRSHAAGRALAAGLHGAEFHGETRLFGQVYRVIEYNNAAMAERLWQVSEALTADYLVTHTGPEWNDIERASRERIGN